MTTINTLVEYGEIGRVASYPQDQYLYPLLGLADETGEVLEKLAGYCDTADIIKELGDVLWYATDITSWMDGGGPYGLQNVTGFTTFDEIIPDHAFGAVDDVLARNLVQTVARICGYFKKLVREDGMVGWASMPYNARRTSICEEFRGLLVIIHTIAFGRGSSIREVAQVNFDKLSSREERGTLFGDGDNR